MFRKFFDPDNALMVTMAQITDCIFLSLFWLLGCLPVVTAGVSTAALYDACVEAWRRGSRHAWSKFLRTYRANLRPGLLPGLLLLGVVSLLAAGVIRLWNAAAAGAVSWAVFSAAALPAAAALGVVSVLCPMLSRFDNSFPALVKNTLLLGLAHLPRTLCLGMINALTGLLCLRYIVPLFFLPALAALLGSLLIEPMFRPYMPEDPSEDAAE